MVVAAYDNLINKHKHSISDVPIFLVISFNSFRKFLRLGHSTWDFLGVIFGPGVFRGFVGSPKDFFGFWFLPLSNGSSTHLTRSDKQLFMTLRKPLRPNKSRVRDRKKGFCPNN